VDHRRNLLEIYRAALAAVEGRGAVRRHLQAHPLEGPLHLVAVGKAATSMTLGALDALGDQISDGLVICKHGHGDPELERVGRLTYLESDHPVPGEQSLAAGRALVDYFDRAPDAARFLVLGSGGASSLVELLPEGCDLAWLQRLTDWLLSGGYDIGTMNRVRKAFSRIKGGRLRRWLRGRPALNLLISDVPGDDPAVVGSGLLVPDHGAPAPLPDELPDWARVQLHDTADVDSQEDRVDTVLVARNADACAAAREAAVGLGYAVFADDGDLDGDAVEAAHALVAQLVADAPGLRIWGGETTVQLPEAPGRGGRNQHLALAAALELAGRNDMLLLAAGTDGTDGPGEDAGALVDGGTVRRGELHAGAAATCLARADAGTFLAAAGDLLQTGPTGTNVMDLALGLRLAPEGG
jgi:hydroxypyruvate reductase